MSEEIFEVTAAQEIAIKQGLEDIEAGNVVPDNIANKEIEEWLGK